MCSYNNIYVEDFCSYTVVCYLTVHRLTRTPLQQSPPDWKNFGQLSDEEAKKAAHRSPRQFQVVKYFRCNLYSNLTLIIFC